jgi:hypothetical protein
VSDITELYRIADTVNRHVAKTDDIKDVVITEESSIAKGIRRVVAVTGHEAAEVSRKAIDFERRLTRIEGLDGKEKEAAMKTYLTVCRPRGICRALLWLTSVYTCRNWDRAVSH